MATQKKIGRPPKYKKKEEIQKIFEVYAEDCVKNSKILTKAGLLSFLDIDRSNYNRLKKKKEFSNTIRKIELLIEDVWVQRLTQTGATGAIFYLKNAFKEDYRDRNETDITSKGEKIMDIKYIIPNDSKRKNNNNKSDL